MYSADLIIIGGGPAGMSAALSAKENGIDDILILERDSALGGILQQCIHDGFGLHKFNEKLTGPEYADRYETQIIDKDIKCKFNMVVTQITKNKVVSAIDEKEGPIQIKAKSIILAMGCRERPRGALNIPGTRPAGIFSAGTAQKFINILGYMPGSEAVIIGSGDIGLIMARRMTLEGAKVKAVCEIMPYCGGLTRNVVQCLEDFDIPLKLSYTVLKIHGRERLEGVTIAKVAKDKKPIKGSEEYITCDTLLFSVGLIPENELSKGANISIDEGTKGPIVDQHRQTSIPGIFACGNVLHVHDLVDFVSEEGEIAGKNAAEYIANNLNKGKNIQVIAGSNIKYTVPQKITSSESVKIYFRVTTPHRKVLFLVKDGDNILQKNNRISVTPSEMEAVEISAEVIKQIKGNFISIEMITNEKEKLEG